VPDLVAVNGRKALSTMDIVAVLTKVTQDLEQQIQKQDRRIKEIENRIDQLKKLQNKF